MLKGLATLLTPLKTLPVPDNIFSFKDTGFVLAASGNCFFIFSVILKTSSASDWVKVLFFFKISSPFSSKSNWPDLSVLNFLITGSKSLVVPLTNPCPGIML